MAAHPLLCRRATGGTLLLLAAAAAALLAAAPAANAQNINYTVVGTGSGNTLYAINSSDVFILKTTFKPCTGFQVHTHPRGYELIMAHSGELFAGYVTEDPNPKLVTQTITSAAPGNAFLVPQGLIHFVLNKSCKNASASFSFPANPGLQFVIAAMQTFPPDLVSFFAGGPIPAQKGALYSQPDAACLKKCGLTA